MLDFSKPNSYVSQITQGIFTLTNVMGMNTMISYNATEKYSNDGK